MGDVAPTGSERQQRDHYDNLALRYDAHANDPTTREYRARFIDAPLREGLDLAGRRVLEAMCGPGYSVGALRARGADVVGLDISRAWTETFRERWPAADAVCASMVSTPFVDGSFDVVYVVGGLHHLHPHLDEAIDEIHRILRSNGILAFYEPHDTSWFDRIRRWWYRRDPLFEDNEAALDLAGMAARHGKQFHVVEQRFVGNVAYLGVLNSLVLRVPPVLKRLLARPLMAFEALLDRRLGERLSCSVVAHWQKFN